MTDAPYTNRSTSAAVTFSAGPPNKPHDKRDNARLAIGEMHPCYVCWKPRWVFAARSRMEFIFIVYFVGRNEYVAILATVTFWVFIVH